MNAYSFLSFFSPLHAERRVYNRQKRKNRILLAYSKILTEITMISLSQAVHTHGQSDRSSIRSPYPTILSTRLRYYRYA
jgi:hypothetical protein